jgi:hypothetical protein
LIGHQERDQRRHSIHRGGGLWTKEEPFKRSQGIGHEIDGAVRRFTDLVRRFTDLVRLITGRLLELKETRHDIGEITSCHMARDDGCEAVRRTTWRVSCHAVV